MGKRGKQNHRSRFQKAQQQQQDEEHSDVYVLPSSAYDLPSQSQDEEEGEGQEDAAQVADNIPSPSKFQLYQQSVQSPKGDISYLQKFFLMYIGGRMPIHLQEDFCGTALLSTEWLRSDPRRTALGVDFDLEALTWCLQYNLTKAGPDCSSRMFLFHGNVLQPQEAVLIKDFTLVDQQQPPPAVVVTKDNCDQLPLRDVVCAFNYSCCCLQKRSELLLYFKFVLAALSKKGGIFVMDVYGGTSSEHKLQLKRKYSNFTYIWEQAEFDVLSRKTKISLHFKLGKKQTLHHAFSYDWRLWSLPEIKDCLEEAGFQSVHFWVREMPDTHESCNLKEFNAASDVKYIECSSFEQIDAWNAYVVGVAK